ncbi:PTS glucose transporter subunit IIA [Oceanobacillus sp. 1P07AA]|uniref:PTS sugar transporter subunit IIA n=1 Tax=Oceanobacillus sp. 1P07AA TaxID=3132293 RepID=UPI0039A457EB
MFKNLFKSKEKEPKKITIVAPITGEIIPLEDVPDPVFSQKMMGEGVAVMPSEGEVVSPVDGEIIQVFPTKHAIGILAENDAEILIHIGLDTVNLDGEGFTAHVKDGDKVKVGDKLMSFDIATIEEKAPSSITPIIISNTDDVREVKSIEVTKVIAGENEILQVIN